MLMLRILTLGCTAAALSGGKGWVGKAADLLRQKAPPSALVLDRAPTWEALAASLEAQSTTEEAGFASLVASGRGPPSASANLRLFDEKDGYEPRVTLYRDGSSWCPYCQKVWMQLEEKRIPYRVERINMRCYGSKPAWFERDAGGLLPVVELRAGQG